MFYQVLDMHFFIYKESFFIYMLFFTYIFFIYKEMSDFYSTTNLTKLLFFYL